MAAPLSPFSILRSLMPGTESKPMDEAVGRVMGFVNAMLPVHKVHERQWFLNIANLSGNQWLTYDKVASRFVTPPAPTWRVRLTINKLLTVYRLQTAKLNQKHASFYVSPENSGNEQMAKNAKTASKFISAISEGENFAGLDDEIDAWLCAVGVCYGVVGYDADEGLELSDDIKDEQGQPVINPISGKPVVRTIKTGDLAISVDTPFEVIPDYSTTRWSEMSAMCRRKLRSVEYVKEKYGVEVSPESLSMEFSHAIRAMEQMGASSNQVDINPILNGAVIVYDYYEAPCKAYPKGRHLIVAGGKLLHDGVLKVKHKGKFVIPIVPYTAIPLVGRLMPIAPVEPLLPLQWEYNLTRSQIIEDLRAMGRPKIVSAAGSLIKGDPTDQPGEHIEYDPAAGAQPYYLNPPAISNGKLDHLQRLEMEMMEIGGIHDLEHGRIPRRAGSGYALSILDEKDNTVMAPMIESKKRGHAKLFSMALFIVNEEFLETRKVKMMDGDKASVMELRGADIGGQYDVRVVPDEPFPTSRSARLEYGTALVQSGILSPRTVRRMLRINDFTQVDDVMLDEEDQRIQAAAMENKRLAKQNQDVADLEALEEQIQLDAANKPPQGEGA